jgi:hypothetical protein
MVLYVPRDESRGCISLCYDPALHLNFQEAQSLSIWGNHSSLEPSPHKIESPTRALHMKRHLSSIFPRLHIQALCKLTFFQVLWVVKRRLATDDVE